MSVNLEQYKPVTYWVFTTNALRSNIGDGTLEYYKRYESPISSYRKEDAPFSADHPEFSIAINLQQGEIRRKMKLSIRQKPHWVILQLLNTRIIFTMMK